MLRTRKRVLVINAYLDGERSANPRRLFLIRPMAQYYLAGYFDRETVEVRAYDEFFDGQLLNEKLFAWPDLVVFTGLTANFDRARQLAAYLRSSSPNVVTVVGGPIARALPKLCRSVFDYVLHGDVEEVGDLIESVLGVDCRVG